jgi:DNA-binding NtrC family response regulator
MNKTIHVLLVDDEELIRINLQAYLEDEGFDVSTATSAEEALQLLPDIEPDIAVIDMRLPDMDGNTLILKANEIKPEMQYIIFTGSTNYVPPVELARLGITRTNIFTKPLTNMGTMTDTIQKLVEGR